MNLTPEHPERTMADEPGENAPSMKDGPSALPVEDQTASLRFLRDEGLDFLNACRRVEEPAARRAILILLRSLADR